MAKLISEHQKAGSRFARNKNNQTNLDFDKSFRIKALCGNLFRGVTDRNPPASSSPRGLTLSYRRAYRRSSACIGGRIAFFLSPTPSAEKEKTPNRTHKPKKTQNRIPFRKPYEPSTKPQRSLNEARSNRPKKPSFNLPKRAMKLRTLPPSPGFP